jgi:hypothetical protein
MDFSIGRGLRDLGNARGVRWRDGPAASRHPLPLRRGTGSNYSLQLIALERVLASANRLRDLVGERRRNLDFDRPFIRHILGERIANDVCLFPVKC